MAKHFLDQQWRTSMYIFELNEEGESCDVGGEVGKDYCKENISVVWELLENMNLTCMQLKTSDKFKVPKYPIIIDFLVPNITSSLDFLLLFQLWEVIIPTFF